MKRRILLAVAVVLMAVNVCAEPVSRKEARKLAEQFLSTMGTSDSGLNAVAGSRRKVARDDNAVEELYVFNRGGDGGFVIVSGDDQTEPILGYCDHGQFDYESAPPGLRALIDGYRHQIASLQSSGQGRADAPIIRDAVPTHPKVAQLMKSKWSQGYPYNMTCPEYFSLGRSVTGCVATAMAQILYYNREKSVSETTAAMPSYDTWTEHATYGKLHVDGIPEGSPIDWENMKDEYGSATEKQRKAVADLMHYCGVAVKMDYTNSSSGAQSHDAYEAFAKYFGYGKSVKYVSYATVSSDTEWDKIIYAEISAGRPVYVSGSNDEGGHAFVADGYDGNQKYHINWGWGGTSDGFYLLTSLTPGKQGIGGSHDGYNDYREIIIGIEPENYAEKTMTISDATARKICLDHWDANGDGKLTYGEAAAVNNLGTVFQGTAIKTFKELYYFTNLTELPDDAFNGCQQLTTIRLPKNISLIGARSLKGCMKLSQLDLPDHVKSIGEEAFSGCSQLSVLQLPDELKLLSAGILKGCEALTSVDLPITVTAIGDQAFSDCKSLKTFELNTYQPEDIALGQNVFENCNLSQAVLYTLQGTKSYLKEADQWKQFGTVFEQRELSGGKFATLESGAKYYIYHVGTGRYLTRGEAYGTQAVVDDNPMRFIINHTTSMADGVYYLTSEDTGAQGNLLFRTSTDSNVGKGVKSTFVDGTLSKNRANAYWSIRPVEGAKQVYTIQVDPDQTGYDENLYWGVKTDHQSNAATPTYGVYWDVDYAENPQNCQWRLVRYDGDAVKEYEAAATLAMLLDNAKGRHLNVDAEQQVYDNLESSYDEMRQAQRQLRKKLKLIDAHDDIVREVFVSNWDIDSDGELSYDEASKVVVFDYSFQNNKKLVSIEELQYFTSISEIYGNTFDGCSNLESVVLPPNITYIYYRAFRNCKKLERIDIPELVTTIGENCFTGCTALKEVSVANSEPSTIKLGTNIFGNVKLAECTLYVPFGAKQRFEDADVWKNFGKIVEVRMNAQPRTSSIVFDTPGYIYNLGTRKYLTMGEAYGTQSVVAANGLKYQFKRSSSMAEGLCYLYGPSGKVVFRTSTDSKVGSGIKTCFGDGSLSKTAYWQLDSVSAGIYTLQVPANDASYREGEYLGIDENHKSNAASPTFGLYWDIAGTGINCQWVFITEADMQEAQAINTWASRLKELLGIANEREIDVTKEQATYDRSESTANDLKEAVNSVRAKLHYITFADSKVQTICISRWDMDGDEELSFEEAAAVTDIGEAFLNATNTRSLEELRYFTSLTEIPANAFRGASSLHTIYLPAGIKAIGDYAFRGCNVLNNIVMLNNTDFIPMAYISVPNNSQLFVPASMVKAYADDEAWTSRCEITEYTGKPVITAEAQRIYGRSSAVIKTKVYGAPVIGQPDTECEAIKEFSLPVGQYPITVTLGAISTPGVECKEGVLTIEPAPLTVTAKSYTRQVGEQNPVFELTYKGFRNHETEDIIKVAPIVTCEATTDSAVGEYAIIVSGGEAPNYTFVYEPGVLTVGDATAIETVVSKAADSQSEIVYDLQGRRTKGTRKGVYIVGKRKIYHKNAQKFGD